MFSDLLHRESPEWETRTIESGCKSSDCTLRRGEGNAMPSSSFGRSPWVWWMDTNCPSPGRLCEVKTIPHSAPTPVQRAVEASLAVKGAKLFNLVPKEIRNIDSKKINVFKRELDKFLTGIPDEPTVEGQGRAAQTNSLLHQIPIHFHQNHY